MLKTLQKIQSPRLNDFNYLENPLEGYEFGISKNKVYSPGPLNYYEIKLMVQDLGIPYFLPTSKEMSIAKEAGKIKFERGSEMTDDLIVKSDSNYNFTKMVRKPVLKRGRETIIIQRPKVVKEKDIYFIEGGERTELGDFITHDLKVRKGLEVLGLKKGDLLFIDKDFTGDQGIRAVTRFFNGAAFSNPWRIFNNSFYLSVRGR